VSHFKKFRDNVRISILNTVLVAMSLFRLHLRPSQIALALGIGVFVGCTPFFGLHTAIVAVIALVFRLNAAVLWLGSQISIPPLAPILAYTSIKVGEGSWLKGSLVVGSLLGTCLGLVTFIATTVARRKVKYRKANWT